MKVEEEKVKGNFEQEEIWDFKIVKKNCQVNIGKRILTCYKRERLSFMNKHGHGLVDVPCSMCET